MTISKTVHMHANREAGDSIQKFTACGCASTEPRYHVSMDYIKVTCSKCMRRMREEGRQS